MEQLDQSALVDLREKAYILLAGELVTSEGIYASSSMGWDGPYHAWFGRDGDETGDSLISSVEYGGDEELAMTAVSALKNFAKWQGRVENPVTGEERGKMPHEIRKDIYASTHAVQHAANTNELPWFIDPEDKTLKNWDSADATPLWTLAMMKATRVFGPEISDEHTEHAMRRAFEWIMKNQDEHDGLIGFTGAALQPGRKYSGLHNQGWKDTERIYQTPDGELAPHPIKDVLVNAEAWAALHEGALHFAASDPDFSGLLENRANILRHKFNDPDHGFVVMDGNTVLAQAIDGNGDKLTQPAIDQGAVLWARTSDGQLVVDHELVEPIVSRMMAPDMFNPRAGIRNYALGTAFKDSTNYHGSSNTYWPFMSKKVAQGMLQNNYKKEAKQVMYAFLTAIDDLGTNIEMFIQNEQNTSEAWSHPHPDIGQMSSRQQAWTAAAVYHAASYLLQDDYKLAA